MTPVSASSVDRAVTASVVPLFRGDATTSLPTIGIELEMIVFQESSGRPELTPLADAARAIGDLADVSFEPGGQIEIHPGPSPTVAGALTAVGSLLDEVARRLRGDGIGLLAVGVDPWHTVDEVALQLRTERYLAMDAHYSRFGTAGRLFMRQTASTQACIGLRPGPAGHAQWRAANLLAPLLGAMFANSPMRENRAVGHNGARTQICRLADPGRHHGVSPTADPVRAYSEFAARARPLGPRYAGLGGLAEHLTTLFPPVRPRGTYLELRSIDALGGHDLAAAIVLATSLLAIPEAVLATTDALTASTLDHAERWRLAAGPGIREPRLRAEGVAVIDIALRALERFLPTTYFPAHSADLLQGLRSRMMDGHAAGDDTLARLKDGVVERDGIVERYPVDGRKLAAASVR